MSTNIFSVSGSISERSGEEVVPAGMGVEPIKNDFYSSVSSGMSEPLGSIDDVGIDPRRTFNNLTVSEDSEEISGDLYNSSVEYNEQLGQQIAQDLIVRNSNNVDFQRQKAIGKEGDWLVLGFLGGLITECENERKIYLTGNLHDYAKNAIKYVYTQGNDDDKKAVSNTIKEIMRSGGRIVRNYDMFLQLLKYQAYNITDYGRPGKMKIILPDSGGVADINNNVPLYQLVAKISQLRAALQKVTLRETSTIFSASDSFLMMAQSLESRGIKARAAELAQCQAAMQKQIMDQSMVKNQLIETENQLKLAYGEYSSVLKSKQALENQYAVVLSDLDSTKKSLKFEQAVTNSFNSLVEKIKETYGGLVEAENKNFELIRTKMDKMQELYNTLTTSNNSLSVSCEGYKNSIEGLEKSYNGLCSMVETMNAVVNSVSANVSYIVGLPDSVSEISGKISSLQETINAINNKIGEENIPGTIAHSIASIESSFATTEKLDTVENNIKTIINDLQSNLVNAIDRKTFNVDLSKIQAPQYVKPSLNDYLPIVEGVIGAIDPRKEGFATKKEIEQMLINNGKVLVDEIIKAVNNSSVVTKEQLNKLTIALNAVSQREVPGFKKEVSDDMIKLLEKLGTIESSLSSISSAVAVMAAPGGQGPPRRDGPPPGNYIADVVNDGAEAGERALSVRMALEMRSQSEAIGAKIASILARQLPAIIGAPIKIAEVPIEWFQSRYHLPSIATREEVFRKWVPWIMNKSRSVHTPISQRQHGMVEVRGKDKDPFVDPSFAAKEVKRRSVARQNRIVKRRKKDAESFFSMLF